MQAHTAQGTMCELGGGSVRIEEVQLGTDVQHYYVVLRHTIGEDRITLKCANLDDARALYQTIVMMCMGVE